MQRVRVPNFDYFALVCIYQYHDPFNPNSPVHFGHLHKISTFQILRPDKTMTLKNPELKGVITPIGVVSHRKIRSAQYVSNGESYDRTKLLLKLTYGGYSLN